MFYNHLIFSMVTLSLRILLKYCVLMVKYLFILPIGYCQGNAHSLVCSLLTLQSYGAFSLVLRNEILPIFIPPYYSSEGTPLTFVLCFGMIPFNDFLDLSSF